VMSVSTFVALFPPGECYPDARGVTDSVRLGSLPSV
jgi:hypothetical protein